MKTASLLSVLAFALLVGCAGPYVDPGKTNPGKTGDITRSETISAGPRIVNKLLADPGFSQAYAAKVAQKGGAPALQVAYFTSSVPNERLPASVSALREDIETALGSSGRFVLSGDPAACDYILKGNYSRIPDGRRFSHRIALRLHDTVSDTDVWTGSDEFAKE